MLRAEKMKDAEQRRLAWRCRRGLLELDIVLAHFIENAFDEMTMDDLQAFDTLLNFTDQAFWRFIQAPNTQSDETLQRVLYKIKATNTAL